MLSWRSHQWSQEPATSLNIKSWRWLRMHQIQSVRQVCHLHDNTCFISKILYLGNFVSLWPDCKKHVLQTQIVYSYHFYLGKEQGCRNSWHWKKKSQDGKMFFKCWSWMNVKCYLNLLDWLHCIKYISYKIKTKSIKKQHTYTYVVLFTYIEIWKTFLRNILLSFSHIVCWQKSILLYYTSIFHENPWKAFYDSWFYHSFLS